MQAFHIQYSLSDARKMAKFGILTVHPDVHRYTHTNSTHSTKLAGPTNCLPTIPNSSCIHVAAHLRLTFTVGDNKSLHFAL